MSELTQFIEKELGQLLKKSRLDKGLTQVEAARLTGLMPADVEAIENHSGSITLSMLQRYTEALDKRIQIKFF